jgi:Flp pilus assembly protein TadB
VPENWPCRHGHCCAFTFISATIVVIASAVHVTTAAVAFIVATAVAVAMFNLKRTRRFSTDFEYVTSFLDTYNLKLVCL